MRNKLNLLVFIFFLLFIGILYGNWNQKKQTIEINSLEGKILQIENNKLTIQDSKNSIYTFFTDKINGSIGDEITLYYSGLLNKESELQDIEVEKIEIIDDLLPTEWLEDGLFHDYYDKAYQLLKKLTLDEKIGQLLLVRYKENESEENLKTYPFGGFVFYENAFKNKTKENVKEMIRNLGKISKIPLLTAVDEEGGKIVRISSNPNLREEPFLSSKELYTIGGFESISKDTKEKSKLLYELGLNLNLAPVIDVSTNETDYMYERSFGQNTELTKKYAETVIEASKNSGVSYTLKHFPGYGNNLDTHTGSAVDNREYTAILNNDLPPFEAGIKAGAEAVMVSHTIIKNIDDINPASLSPSVHNILRNRLEFSGIIITDDLDMGATSSIENRIVKALLAGNDLIITTDAIASFSEIKNAVHEGNLSEDLINRISLRVLAWKLYKGLIVENEK